MRVISGLAKGHKLKSIQGRNTRPTTDRIKESLFNIIAPQIPGSYVLDLFSGTGALGIESISRGAEFATFVDNSPIAVKTIKENLAHTKLTEYAKVYTCSWFEYIDQYHINQNINYDIIFMDPPYNENFIIPALQKIYSNHILKETGIIVVERATEDIISQSVDGFDIVREKKYGSTVITFIQYSK